MKKKNLMSIVLTGALLLGLLTACGEKNPPTPSTLPSTAAEPSAAASAEPASGLEYKDPTEDMSKWQGYSQEQFCGEDVTGKSIAYQLNGSMTDDQGSTVLVMANIYEDGFARAFQYRNGYVFYYSGYWANMGETITVMFPCYEVTRGGSQNGVYDAGDSYSLEILDGRIDVSFSAYLAGSKYAPRAVEIACDGTVPYATEEAFLTYAQETTGTELQPDDNAGGSDGEQGSEAEVLFSWTDNQGGTTMDFYADCTYKFAFSKMGIEESGTWSMQDWTLTVTREDGTEIIATRDETESTTFILPFVSQTSDKLSRDYTCTTDVWGPALGAEGTYTPAE